MESIDFMAILLGLVLVCSLKSYSYTVRSWTCNRFS